MDKDFQNLYYQFYLSYLEARKNKRNTNNRLAEFVIRNNTMKHPFFLVLSLLITAPAVFSQATQAAEPSAALEILSENQGFLPPRMSTFQRNQIAAPAVGLTIYNTSLQS